MKKISVALATYNEEANIKMCLDAVVGWVDEIVIVDGQSTDQTKKLAEEMGARVITKPNQKNFHINKQIAIDACKSPWILQLDADEVVSRELKAEIEGILRSDEGKGVSIKDGYNIPRKNWFLGRFLMKGGQYPDYTIRFYRNGKGRLPQKDVHEQAVIDGEVGFLSSALLHYPYKNFSAYYTKWQRYNRFAGDLLKTELKHKSLGVKAWTGLRHLLFLPIYWFVWTYGRHKGFMDGWQGFVFCFYSALRFPFAFFFYLK